LGWFKSGYAIDHSQFVLSRSIARTMSRSTIVVGNGLGMACDPDFFRLDRAIEVVWTNAQLIAEHEKELLRRCMPEAENACPRGEDDLDVLQLALSATEVLIGLQGERVRWLSTEGQQFPNAVRKFVYNTAIQFHEYTGSLPDSFLDPLAEYLRSSQSHVGTLNYDSLLYQPLIEREVLKGYYGALVDGFYTSGFRPENLERKYGRTFGYYLHLHGSPLFVDRDDVTVKLLQRELQIQTSQASTHIVLTHVRHKPAVISGSDLLQTYWEYLLSAFTESDLVYLFGYSGMDLHLNALLRGAARHKTVHVVEWSGREVQPVREAFWRQALGKHVKLTRMANILEFTDWGK
jgi:ferredoxin